MYNIDVDTGGTMTDGLVSGNGTVMAVKVETTPHDVTISFVGVLDAVRDVLGYDDLRSLLADVEHIRWSSTITSNVLAERKGPKLGLLVSEGHEQDLYDPAAAATVIGTLVSADDIRGLPPDADEADVRSTIKSLLDEGIRRINVSLAGAFPDDREERRVVDTVTRDYPDHFLGSIPALGGAEVVARPSDATRTIASLINAYVHPALATTLYRAEEIVRDQHGWRGNVLIGHINGGVARIGKTKAFDTIESGPLFGTHACAVAAEQHGDARVIAIDVGGTTAKASAVENGRVVMCEAGDLFGIPLELDMPLLRSIALGGGSVATATDGAVVLGPQSMGAAPGPACYGLGGRKATVTDAFVVAGLLRPDGFLNGKRDLDVELARAALDKHVGTELGIGPDDAAKAVVERAWDMVAGLARDTAAEIGWDPADCTIYAYGGNGPLFVTAVAERLGATTARFFGLGSVYSAFGSAVSDVVLVYESAALDVEHLRSAAENMTDLARRDLRGQGFDPAGASSEWEVRTGGASHRGTDLEAVLAELDAKPTLIRLTARHELPTLELPDAGRGSPPTPTGSHPSPFGAAGSIVSYDAALEGARLAGPFRVDGGSYTWFVTDGWDMNIDTRGDAVLTKG